MITDTVPGLNALAIRLSTFLESTQTTIFVPADDSGAAAPYEELLSGVRFEKASGPILVSRAPEGNLCVRGSVENLLVWVSHFAFPESATDGNHHHPEHVRRPHYIDPRTLSVIIEVEDER
jgi:hypothetical protein